MSAEQLPLEGIAAAGNGAPGPAAGEAATDEQRRAVARRDGNLLVAAGAGSGKTRVLVERYCEAIESDRLEPDAILAFTFTERAAAEMRARIRARLSDRARRHADAAEAARLLAAARATDRAWISTIHGFCRRLLAAHPLAAGIDPRFRVADDGEASRLAARAFDGALEDFLADRDEERARLVAAFGAPLRGALRAAHDALRSQRREPLLPEIAVPDPAPLLSRLGELAPRVESECAGSKARSAQENYERLERARRVADGEETLDPGALAELRLSRQAAAFRVDCVDEFNALLDKLDNELEAEAALRLYEPLRELAQLFAGRYAALKRDRSALDFEDLQLEAVRMLEASEPLRDAYRTRFRHILVDELQDSNRVQARLVELLAGPETSVFEVGDELQSIYSFRHADLGVFRDRRAALEAREEVVGLSCNFRSAPAVVAAVNALGRTLIGEGFAPLVAGRDPELHAADDEGRGIPRAAPAGVELLLVPAARGTDPWKELAAADTGGQLGLRYRGDGAPTPAKVAEARLLAARLRALREAGVPARHMVVLLRAYTHVAAFERELARAGLDPYVVGGRGYFSHQQVDDVRRILAAVANPLDDLALLGTLSSPACAVGPDALWILRQVAGTGRLWPALGQVVAAGRGPGNSAPEGSPAEGSPPEDDPNGAGAGDPDDARRWTAALTDADLEALGEAATKLERLRSEAAVLPLDELIDRAISTFSYDLALLLREGGRRRLANVRKLMALARSFEAAEGRDLRGFLDSLDDRARDAEGEAATSIEGHDGVRVMTIHAAKGLEFPVVAVGDLGRDLIRGAAPRILVGPAGGTRPPVAAQVARLGEPAQRTPGYDALKEEAAAAEVAEELRLLHVAATRAERNLILCGSFDPALSARVAAGEQTRLGTPISDRLVAGLGLLEDGEVTDREIAVVAPEATPELAAVATEQRISVRAARPDPAWVQRLAGAPAAQPPQRPTERPRRLLPAAPAIVPRRLSFSALSEYERCGYRFGVERLLGVRGAGGHGGGGNGGGGDDAGARQLGSAVHLLLEHSARRGWRAPAAEEVEAALRRAGAQPSPARMARAEAMIAAWLESEMLARIREAGSARAELPFAIAIGDAVVNGKIDLLCDLDGAPLVVDYKTSSLAGSSPGELAREYEVQRDIYRLAAASLGAPVRTAFVFLEAAGDPVRAEAGPEEIERARERIERLVAGARSGSFEPAEPSWELCGDCPARELLCPRWDGGEVAPAPAGQ